MAVAVCGGGGIESGCHTCGGGGGVAVCGGGGIESGRHTCGGGGVGGSGGMWWWR